MTATDFQEGDSDPEPRKRTWPLAAVRSLSRRESDGKLDTDTRQSPTPRLGRVRVTCGARRV